VITLESVQNPSMPTEAPPQYTIRQLPVEEWPRLLDYPFGSQGLPAPELAVIFVAETEGKIVGVWAAETMVLLDGLWTDPDHRAALVAGRLLGAMRSFLQSKHLLTSFTVISDPSVMVLAHKAGFTRYPGDLWVLQLPPAEETR
jgi:hypothetical protein